MRLPARRFHSIVFVVLIALVALVALGFTLNADSAVVYRWVDQHGKVHFGDTVPSEYKAVARVVDRPVAAPSAEEQRQALARVAEQKAKLQQAGASAPASAPRGAAASQPPVLIFPIKRPPHAPTPDTDCETWRRLYQESLDCFGPYMTVRGAIKVEAFDACTPVSEPPPRCGRNAQ
jgi:Domain of unknown function (DUF4124)